jgi:hypothetical protein
LTTGKAKGKAHSELHISINTRSSYPQLTVIHFNTMTLFMKSFIYLSCVLSVVSGLRATLAMNYLGSKPVFVAGGSRGVGLEVVKQLSALGTPVQTLVRNDEAKANLEGMDGVKVFLGDALDESCVQQAMGGTHIGIWWSDELMR